MKHLFAAAMLMASAAGVARADLVTVGAIQLAPDNPSLGLLSFIVSNISGPLDCDATFNSCTALTFDNGVLTVNYLDVLSAPQVFTANLPNGFGVGSTDPSSFIDFTVDPTGWTLQTVSFAGTLSPANIVLFGGAPRTFSPLTFAGSFDATLTDFALLTADASVPVTTAVPEPAGLASAGFALLALWRWRRKRQPQTL